MKCRMCDHAIENPKRNQVYCKSCAVLNNKRQKAQLCGVFRAGQRGAETRDLAKYRGKALFLRRLRLAKYQQASSTSAPYPTNNASQRGACERRTA